MSEWYNPTTWFGGEDPSEAANKYLEQIPGTVTPYYNPYIKAGNAQIPGLMHQYGQLTRNPGGKVNQMGQSFQQSPGYQWQLQQALYGANNAAAAGGMAGSPQHEQQNEQLASNLANQDYYNWLNHAMGLYNTGLQGKEGLYQTGYGASDALARLLNGALESEASAAYGATPNINTILGAAGSAATAAAMS